MPRLGRSRPASAYLFIGRKPQPQGTAHTATASLTVTPSFSAGRVRGKYRTGALTVTPSFAAARVRGKYRTGSLAVSPSFSAARLQNHVRAGSLIVAPSFSAARIAGRHRSGSLAVTPSFQATWTGGAAPVIPQGSWWGLHSVFEQQRSEFEAFVAAPPMACPNCGEPLTNGPVTASGSPTASGSSVERYCRFGDFQYPRDYISPQRPR